MDLFRRLDLKLMRLKDPVRAWCSITLSPCNYNRLDNRHFCQTIYTARIVRYCASETCARRKSDTPCVCVHLAQGASASIRPRVMGAIRYAHMQSLGSTTSRQNPGMQSKIRIQSLHSRLAFAETLFFVCRSPRITLPFAGRDGDGAWLGIASPHADGAFGRNSVGTGRYASAGCLSNALVLFICALIA